jgi:hypothetical protein
MISAMSCNTEELFIEPVGEEVINLEDEEDVLEEEEQAEEDASLPCDFDLNTIAPNSTIRINCIMDLDGATISVPANVSILYEGGDIINGTLNFSDNTIISGELLNSTLTLSGSNPQLKDPVFNFIPPRWDIVEGEVPQDVANRNTLIINEILIKVKAMGASNFKLDKLDAYFYGDLKHRGGIEIPSNMNFEMTDKTHLRAHVTAGFRSLIFLGEKENIVISGGNLHGNRNIPGFDPYVSGGQSLIVLKTGINVTMENIHLSNSANDGINIESMKHAYEVDYVPTRNILINGCTFDSNRRNNLSITDGLDMVVENCTFLNAGIDMQYSTGSAPRYAIDLEPHIKDIDKPLQHLEHVTLRNNVERGSVAGGIVFADGDYYVFENNDFEGGAHIVGAANVQIINNKIGKRGITHGDDPGGWYTMMRNENNVVAGNTITGEGNGGGIGINAVNKGLEIYDNHIIDMGVGILIRGLRDSHIYNNLIESNGLNDDGINGLFFIDNVLIEDNVIKVKDFAFYFDGVNSYTDYENYSFTIKNNIIETEFISFFSNVGGLNFIENNLNSGLRLTNCQNTMITNNSITASKPFSIELTGNETDNLSIIGNVIENDDNAGLGHGISGQITSSENKNIEISSNQFSNKGSNSGIAIQGFHGITVKDNSGFIEARPLIKYKGNNSVFTNNIRLNEGSEIENEIEGTNNTIN